MRLRKSTMTARPPYLPAAYNDAKKALAALTTIAAVKTIHDKAEALERYAYLAKNPVLMAKSIEVRMRSLRRLGQLIEDLGKAGLLAKGGDKGGRRSKAGIRKTPANAPKSLEERNVNKNLAQDARKAKAMPEDKWEAQLAKITRIAVASTENVEAVIKQIRAELVAAKLENRKRRHQIIRAASMTDAATIAGQCFPLIYADPAWLFKTYTPAGGMRSPDEHYPTMTDDEIADYAIGKRPIREIAYKDAALFLWCTSSNIPLALRVMEAWGFTFKASAVWVKDKQGTGQVFRNWHEVLLYGSRGNMPGPLYLPPSVLNYPRGKHSEKPPEIRAEIEKMYPYFDETSRLELFARGHVKGWTTYGYEAKTSSQAAE
jgi:N6-adenosine-specific RNA methylase IME4